MFELTLTELQQVSGGGTKIGTTGSGDVNAAAAPIALGGTLDPGGSN